MAIAVPMLWVILIDVLTRNFKYFTHRVQTSNKIKHHQAGSLLFLFYVIGFPLIFFLLISIKVRVGAHWAAIVYPSSCVLIAIWFYLVKGEIQPVMIKLKSFITSIIMAVIIFNNWEINNSFFLCALCFLLFSLLEKHKLGWIQKL